ncbi:MAG: helix-turn-helix domain-containing protein [Bifidobacterium choerinum]
MFGQPNNYQQPYNAYNNQYGAQYGNDPYQQQQPQVDLGSVADFAAGGGKSFFNADSQPGASVTGIVTAIEVTQYHDFQTKAPGFWKDGRPQKQLHITIQTDLQTDPDDDGLRSIWIKGWGKQMQAYRDARRLNGGKDPRLGDMFTATYVGLGERGNAPQPPKIYRYEIKPGNSPEVAAFGAEPQQQPQQQAAPQVNLTPQLAAVSDEQRAQIIALRNQGMAPAQVAAQLGLTEQQVYDAGHR